MATIKKITNVEDFASLKDRWNAIVYGAKSYRCFQTFEWNYYGWKYYHALQNRDFRLYILDVTRDGHPDEYAIFPFCVTGDGKLQFLMQMISDVVHVIEPYHDSNWHTFYHDVIKYVENDPDVRGVDFLHLEGNSEFFRIASAYLSDVRIEHLDAFSVLVVQKSENFVESLVHLSSKERSYIRSLIKKSNSRDFRILCKQAGDEYPVERITALRDAMCENGTRVKSFFPDATIAFLGKIFDAGLCQLSVLVGADGSFEECSTRLLLGSHDNFWVVLYKTASDTTMVDARYMTEMAHLSDCEFDFGTGAYSYKLGTFKPDVYHLYRVYTAKKTIVQFLRDLKELCRVYVKAWIGRK